MSIVIKNLSFTYSKDTPFETDALKDINFEIEQGEFLGIIGHTGSGKTTLIHQLAGLIKIQKGDVCIDGEHINDKDYDKKKIRKKIGVVFQYPEYQLFEETVYKDIAFAPKKAGFDEKQIDEAVLSACEILNFDIEKYGEKSPFELSGGQKRKVAIAGVLAVDPDILILDEPVAGLDPKGRQNLMDLITKLNGMGKTIIMITHSMDDLAKYAKRVIVMNAGKIVYDRTPKEVFSKADSLIEMGLDIPQATKIVRKLNEQGKNLPNDIITIEDLKDCIVARIGHKEDIDAR